MMEAAVALFIVAILASLLVPLASSLMNSSRGTQDYSELQTIYTAIVGNPQLGTYGYLGDVGDYPTTLTDLITPSVTTGWNGPYVNGVRTDSSGRLLDPYGGVVEYVQVTSSTTLSNTFSGADYLGLVSKGPDLGSTNPNQSSNARSGGSPAVWQGLYPWLSGYSAGTNLDNVLYPNIIDSPGQIQYQGLGTLSYDLYNFDANAKVNTTVPGCSAAYQLTVTSVPRGTSDQFTLMYNPGGASVDLIQGNWGVSIYSNVTSSTVFSEQVAVLPGGSNTRTIQLPPIDSSTVTPFLLTISSAVAVDVYDYTNTKVLSNKTSGSVNIKACSPVLIKNTSTSVVMDSFYMPWKAITRIVNNPNTVATLKIIDSPTTDANTMLKVYAGGSTSVQGLLVGTISNKGNRKAKTFVNLHVGDTIMFENQAGSLFNGVTCTVGGTCSPSPYTFQ